MRFISFLNETQKIKNTMIGFGVNKKSLTKITRYLKSWFDRYNVEYIEEKNKHITVAQILGKYPKDELMRTLQELPKDVMFSPKKLTIFKGINFKKDFYVLEYKINQTFLDAYSVLNEKYEIRHFDEPRPHISLFNTELDAMQPYVINMLMQMFPKLPKIKTETVQLWNSKFEVEFTSKE